MESLNFIRRRVSAAVLSASSNPQNGAEGSETSSPFPQRGTSLTPFPHGVQDRDPQDVISPPTTVANRLSLSRTVEMLASADAQKAEILAQLIALQQSSLRVEEIRIESEERRDKLRIEAEERRFAQQMDLEERRFAFEQKRWTEQFELAKSMHIDVSAIGGGSLLLPGPREGSAGMMMRNAVKDSPPREVPIVEAPRKSIAPKKGPIKKTIFISYCWQNSRRQMEMDVTAGKKPASVIDDAGVTDPRMIYDILKSQGWDVWLDVVKLGAGQPLIDQLAEAIRNEAGIVIVHASDAYADSANCKKEYFFAQKMKLPMIPLIVGKSPSADTGREDEKTESVEVAEPPADTTSAAAKKIANEKRDKRIVGVEKRKPVSDKAVNKPKLPSWDYTWLGMDISPTLYIDARNPNDQEGAINQLIEAIESKLKEVDGDADSESGLDLNTLRDAVNAGAVEEARKFIADGYDVNKFNTDKKELPLIHVAVAKDNAEMVKLLLDCGAEVEAKGLLERTPIIAAAGHGSPEVISILLAMGANVNSYDSNKSTALHLAAASNTKEVCKLLLEKNASLEVQDKIGYTTLFSAVAALNIETTQLLIENGADISVIEPVRKQSLMHCAAGTEPTADGITVVKYLVSAGCDKDQRDIHNFTPLIWAIHEGHVEIAQYLLSLGGAFDGTLDTSDDNNYEHENNIIQLCAHYGYLELLQSIVPLVSRDVLLNKTNQNGWTAMTYTVARGYVNMAKFLHSVSPLFINEKTSNKMNLISIASSYGQLETLQWLLSESGIRYSLEDADSSLLTPIMHSISGKNMAVFDYLREKGAKLDVCMPNMVKNEVNIVQICCSAGNIEFLKKILEVEPSLKKQLYEVSPYNGWSTMMYAISSNSVEMVEFLHSLGVDFSSLSSDGDSVTENICEFGSVEMLRAVLKLDASSINSPNYFGLTPLMETIMSTTEQNAAAGTLVNALLEHGALFNVGGFDAMNLLNELVSKDSLRSDNTDLIKLICAHIPDTVTLDDMDNYDQLCLKVIECKDLGLLKSIISHGIELSKRNTCYLADLLCSAASIGHVEIFKFLKNQIPAMSINDAGSREKRPIDCAAEEGAVEMIEYLHQIGATFETHGDEEDTLLHLAVQSSKLQCVKAVVKLIPQSVNIDSVNKAFRTPMTNAIESGNFDIVKYLLSEGASLSFKAPNGDSCLHIAFSNATAETKDMIQFLLQNMPASFSLNDENDNGISCLTLALRNEENEALLKLIVTQSKLSWSLSPNGKKNIFEAFLNVWSPNPAGILPILKAVQEPSLINVKAGQNTTLASKVLDSSGYSNDVLSFLKHLKALNFAHFNDPKLFFSALQNHGNMIEILEFLLSCLSPEALPEVINAADDELVTLMGHAALYSNLKAVKVLHAAGSTLACRSTIGRNLLHFACAASKSSESKAILEFLIDKVSPSILNERDNDGWTPLYQAFKTPNLDAVPILLSHGADVTILANDGTSVYDAWLALYDEDFTLESFKALSATWKTSIDLLDDGGNTALAIFARKGDIESMKECLAMGASLDWRQPGSGLNLAGFAAQDAEFDSIKFLETVIPGCCMVENERGQNALTISLQEGHLHIFEYILAKAPTLSNSVRKELLFQAAIHGHAGYVKQFMTEESSSMLEEKIDVWHLTPCNGCSKNEGSEIRYRCFTCNIDDDCYLCESCLPKAEEIHKPNHNFCPVTDTLLTVSVSMGQDNVAHVLLQGATSLSDAVTSTLLTFACMRGFLDLIQIVLKMVGSAKILELYDAQGHLPYHYAVQQDHNQIIRWMEHAGLSVGFTKGGLSLLSLATQAAAMYSNEFKTWVMMRRHELDIPDDKGWTPVAHALESGEGDSVQTLVKAGANLDIIFKDNRTLFELADEGNRWTTYYSYIFPALGVEQAKLVLQKKNGSGMPVISNLLSSDYGMDSTKFLAKHIPDALKTADEQGWTALCWAVKQNEQTSIEYLISHFGVSVLEVNLLGEEKSLLEIAAGSNGLEAYFSSVLPNLSEDNIKKLIATDTVSDTSFLALLIQSDGQVQRLKYLVSVLKSEEILHAADSKGWSPLCYAVQHGAENLLQYLLEVGAKVDVELKGEDKNLVDIAKSNGTLSLLFENLPRFKKEDALYLASLKNADGENLMMLAVLNCDLCAVEYLVSIGAHLALEGDEKMRTLLHIGASSSSDNKAILNYLSKKMPDSLNAVDADGLTPFTTAVKAAIQDNVQFFIEKKASSVGLIDVMMEMYSSASAELLEVLLPLLDTDTFKRLDVEVLQSLYLGAANSVNLNLARTLFKNAVPISAKIALDSNNDTLWGLLLQEGSSTISRELMDFFIEHIPVEEGIAAKLNSSLNAFHKALGMMGVMIGNNFGDVDVPKKLLVKFPEISAVFTPYVEGDKSLRFLPGYTVVHMAAQRGTINVLKWLRSIGSVADFNARDAERGLTPLMVVILDQAFTVDENYTVPWIRMEVVKLLIECGADVNAADNEGHKVLDYAEFCKSKGVVETLKAAGATSGVAVPEDYNFGDHFEEVDDSDSSHDDETSEDLDSDAKGDEVVESVERSDRETAVGDSQKEEGGDREASKEATEANITAMEKRDDEAPKEVTDVNVQAAEKLKADAPKVATDTGVQAEKQE